ncbi:MAG: squalene/phytoene synthase family protein [Solirubrobacteraceae bacterium]
MSGAATVAESYSHCESVARTQAANFFYGIRVLPRDRRRAMCAVYAFARRVDDIGDGTLEREEKLRRLDAEARGLAAIAPDGAGARDGAGAPDGEDPVMVALADAHRRFALPSGALGQLIEGVRMDVSGTTYEVFEELVLYCRRVAGTIGRVCLAIFGLREDAGSRATQAEALADDLGVALQLTNILRDVREDAENGRVYLPAEDLRRFGLIADGDRSKLAGREAPELLAGLARAVASSPEGPPGGAEERERLAALVCFEAERAREWFDRGITLSGLLDRRSAASVLAMAGIYRRLLDRIEADPEQAVRRRMSLPAREKAWVAARCIFGAGV